MLSIMALEVYCPGERFRERKTIVWERPQIFHCLLLWTFALSLFVIPLVHLGVATGQENSNYLAIAVDARPGNLLLYGEGWIGGRAGL